MTGELFIDERRYDGARLLALFDSREAAADTFGVEVRTVLRWASEGLSWWRADELAGMIRRHPGTIWPEWWDITLLDDAEQVALPFDVPDHACYVSAAHDDQRGG